jgi:hypothetical protein
MCLMKFLCELYFSMDNGGQNGKRGVRKETSNSFPFNDTANTTIIFVIIMETIYRHEHSQESSS